MKDSLLTNNKIEKTSPILQTIRVTQAELEGLHKAIEALCQKLSPLFGAPSPENPEAAIEPIGSSNFCEELNKIFLSARYCRNRLDSIYEQLEL
jgi:hypothetical protein